MASVAQGTVIDSMHVVDEKSLRSTVVDTISTISEDGKSAQVNQDVVHLEGPMWDWTGSVGESQVDGETIHSVADFTHDGMTQTQKGPNMHVLGVFKVITHDEYEIHVQSLRSRANS